MCDAISQLVYFALEMLQCKSLPTRTSRTSPPSNFYAHLRFPGILVNSGVIRWSRVGEGVGLGGGGHKDVRGGTEQW